MCLGKNWAAVVGDEGRNDEARQRQEGAAANESKQYEIILERLVWHARASSFFFFVDTYFLSPCA